MKRLFSLFLIASSMWGATASLPITFTANTLVVTDIQTYLERQVQATSTLGAAVASTDTTLTLASLPTNVPASGVVLIGSELIAYTGTSGAQLTGLTRGTTLTNAANNTTAAAYTSGTTVQFLVYSGVTPWIKALVLSQVQSAILSLGSASALVGTNEATISTNQATVATALGTAIQ